MIDERPVLMAVLHHFGPKGLKQVIDSVPEAEAILGKPATSPSSLADANLKISQTGVTQEGVEYVVVRKDASDGLLMSMAIRYDHGLGVPGYYDQPVFGAENVGHQKRLDATMRAMRQLHEEVVGAGFYHPDREADYRAMTSPEALEAGV
ncbi:hypothetical protein AB4099_34015 [Bosea sp. 2KB_26]|uniref:hypothetical protein n=1 Tax=Bosea sp. 2KB_26 TaxID=3237475 RepID=UPI003F8F7AE1